MDPEFKAAAHIFRNKSGILRMSEALRAGISRGTLYAMRDEGVVEQLSRGVYRLTELPGLESPDLVTVAKRIPRGVICLISALAYHELTTQVPHAVDMAVIRGSEKPRIDYPPVNVYWFSGNAFTEGIKVHRMDGGAVRIYSAEKSVADAFKYRNKIGKEIAIEALRNWRHRPKARVQELVKQAKNCRVERVMRPYLEAIL